ncbi:hypothetical protein JCM19992_22110 [Thermostilla marina]
MKANSPLTKPLRKTLAECTTPLLVIAKATGIARASLIRFRRGETSLRLDKADALAAYFGLVLVRRDEVAPKRRPKRNK